MGLERSNKGQQGVQSIRIGGMRIDDLPIAEGALAGQQLPDALETERQNEIAAVRAAYPKQSVDALKGRVRESESNIGKFKRERGVIEAQRSEYKAKLGLCLIRDRKIAEIDEDDPEREALIKDLNHTHGMWVVEAMQSQIRQFDEGIERFEAAVEQERESLLQLREMIVLCGVRDKELRKLGG